jgi:hypothetical protein
MRAILCAAILALAITTAGAAEPLNTGNYLLQHCKEAISAGIAG